MLERRLSRRKFLISTAAAIILPGCESFQDREQSAFPDMREKTPLPGDVVFENNKHYLLRENSEGKFAYEIPDFEKYKKLTKFDKYKRRTFNVGAIPQGYKVQPFNKEKEGGLVDIHTGGWKDAKIFGGEINVFFPGFMTDEGDLHDAINPSNETFFDIRKELKKNHWDLLDNMFFTYGDKGFDEYSARKTVLNPLENIDKALKFFDYLKREFPLVQFNLIGHSLGGLFALEVAKQNPDCINNLILIDSPINGIKKDDSTSDKAKTLKNIIRPFIGEEYVTPYLFDRWNQNSKDENEQFARLFIGSGHGLATLGSTYDLVAPLESKLINGARQVILKGSFESPFLGYLYYHGKALKDEKIIKPILGIIGKNETRNV